MRTIQATDLLGRVKRIEIKAKGLSEQVLSGQYHSAFRGRGMAFSEVRSYQVGDDVRDIDWNVTARYANPFVKVFEEERELTLMLLIDITGSTIFGTREENIKELMAEVAATLAFSALQNNDKIGAIFFSDQIELFIPPKSGRKHVLYIIRELLGFSPRSQATDINIPLRYLTRTIKKRCTAFLMSDFIQTHQESYTRSLTLASYKHDIIAIRAFDKHSGDLPNWGLTLVEDLENGREQWIDTSNVTVRQLYREGYQQQITVCEESCKKSSVDLISISSENDFTKELRRLFSSRS